MKKILCLIDALGTGGAERQMIGLVRFLRMKGYKTDLVTYLHQDSHALLQSFSDLNYCTLKTGKSRWSKIQTVKKYIKENGKFDYIIAYKDGPAVISCILKLLGASFKLIVSERNTNLNINNNDRLKFFLYRFADYVVPNSFSQSIFIKDNFPYLLNKIVTITNFTDTDYFLPSKKTRFAPIKILTVARVAKQKNVLNYLEAIKRIKDAGYNVKFEWYGNIQINEDDYGKEVINRQKELQIEDMISFYPATNDILFHYQSCDIFCLPSIYEGFPNVICEAMSCAKPIVCSRVCDNSNIVHEGVNGLLFDPYSVDNMVEQIIKIISISSDELISYGNASRRFAEEQFSKESFINKYISLFV